MKKAPHTPHGTGAQTAAEGQRLVGELREAQKQHARDVAALSPKEAALHAAKGLLYEELKRLSRAARTVLPEEATRFAVSTKLRGARRKRSAATTKPSASASKASA